LRLSLEPKETVAFLKKKMQPLKVEAAQVRTLLAKLSSHALPWALGVIHRVGLPPYGIRVGEKELRGQATVIRIGKCFTTDMWRPSTSAGGSAGRRSGRPNLFMASLVKRAHLERGQNKK
jgi:hypothetical protein